MPPDAVPPDAVPPDAVPPDAVPPDAEPPPPICSGKGCGAPAQWRLSWNNPRLHPPERRKVWLACDNHRGSLGNFLDARGFLRAVDPLDDHIHS